MDTASIETLKKTSPNAFANRMAETVQVNQQIVSLEKQLGLPASRLTLNLSRAQARLNELRSLAAKSPAVTSAAASTAAAAGVQLPGVTAEQWQAMARSEKDAFGYDGGKLAVSEFEKLSFPQRNEFMKSGGKLCEDPAPLKK